MIIVNISPNKLIQIGYEGEDKVTILRFSYSEKWLENGEGIFTVRVLRNGEKQAYDAQLIKNDRENLIIDMTVTDIELSKEGYGEMQLVYTGADFVKKSPVYKYYVSRSVDEAVDPPESDVYTQIIESLSDLRTNFNELANTVNETNDDIGDLTELTTANKLNIVESINEVNAKSFVSVDDELSDVSTNPVQNNVITARITSAESAISSAQTAIQGKADTSTVTALSVTVSGLRDDVVGLQTRKVDFADFDDLSMNVANLSDAAQQYMERTEAALDDKTEISAFNDLSDTVSGLQTSKADKSYVDTQLAGKINDVQVNETSVVTDGVAEIPIAKGNNYGIVKGIGTYGVGIDLEGTLKIYNAQVTDIKNGTSYYLPITPSIQHSATFYGLAKAAGDTTQSQSSKAVGKYTDEAKTAIQNMLNVPSKATATTSTNGLMSAEDKSRLDAVYEDYSAALTALGGDS